jgi:hypothetical protein
MALIDKNEQVQPGHTSPTDPQGAEAMEIEEEAVVLPPALRTAALTVEEAQTIKQVLEDRNLPRHDGVEMPTADASTLRKKTR